ncbi:hypothetical protein KCH_58230 [Kitasatospora cheerisanensis KCTC 2395]|uniref:Uncharacterized protein n=1 Tax=Kitasatospora cheerisanensis KCTC 2395 TaxID=1348663 RepID=A0A066YW41_9ACTN|nr:hypothetical protein KCH_58230 [Kitasatospora cheerisanensis KCTC 2395]
MQRSFEYLPVGLRTGGGGDEPLDRVVGTGVSEVAGGDDLRRGTVLASCP